jgi:hypothetical protein
MQHRGQVAVCIDIPGIEPDRPLVRRLRLRQFPQRTIGRGKIIVKNRLRAVELHGLRNQFDGGLVVPDLMGEHAEQMESIDLFGISRENLPVEILRLLEFAGLVVAERLLQMLRVRRHQRGFPTESRVPCTQHHPLHSSVRLRYFVASSAAYPAGNRNSP